MRSQFFIIGAVVILIFALIIYSYVSISNYRITIRKPLIINYNWKSSDNFRLIYDLIPNSYYLYINLSLPNVTLNKSTIIVYDRYPRKWQLDNNNLIIYDYGGPIEKNILVYFSNTSGDTLTFDNIPFVDGSFILKNYNLSYNNNVISVDGKLNTSCVCCKNSSGPVFIKVFNGSTYLYSFDDFIKTNAKNIVLISNGYYLDGNYYSCINGNQTIDNEYVVFNDSGLYFEFSNLTGSVNCSNNIWNLNLSKPTNIIISYEFDEFGYRFFGDYRYKMILESDINYFNKILSNYSKVASGSFVCGNKSYGLLNSFGDLIVSQNYVNNSFIFWNFTNFIFDGKNLQFNNITLNGEKLTYKNISNKIVGSATCGNVTFEFFNMTPVVYIKLNSDSICNLSIPIGVGENYRDSGYYFIENNSYVVEFVGDILGYSKYPNFLLRPNSSLYMVILKDKRDLFMPYFYNSKILCPKI